MKNNRIKMLKRVLIITLLLLLIYATKSIYAAYIITRNFSTNLSTSPFNVEVIPKTIKVYNIDVNKVSATIKNNNNYSITGNITFNNKLLKEFEIAANNTQEITDLTLTKTMVSGLNAGNYDLVINITAPYSTTIKNIKVAIEGTIINVEKNGIKVTGTSDNPYLVYAVEDLVLFAQKVNAGTTYSNKYVKQVRNINFNTLTDYYNSDDTSFGNLNGTADDNKIHTEMTTGSRIYGNWTE